MQRGGGAKKDGSGNWPVEFFDVTMWPNAVPGAEKIKRGMTITVIGELRQESWEKDGQKRSKIVIVADHVIDGSAEATPPPLTPRGYDAKPPANLHGVAVTDEDIPF